MPMAPRKRNFVRRKSTAARRRPRRSAPRGKSLATQVSALAKTVKSNQLQRVLYKELTTTLNSTNFIYTGIRLMDLSTYSQMWGTDAGSVTNMSLNKVTVKGFNISMKFESAGQPLGTHFRAMVIRPTKIGANRNTAAMSVDVDYFITIDGKFLLNPRLWSTSWSREFDLAHFEYLDSAPATNSNNAPQHTQKRLTMSHTFKPPLTFSRGANASVYDRDEDDLIYNYDYTLVIYNSNASAVLDHAFTATARLNVTAPN